MSEGGLHSDIPTPYLQAAAKIATMRVYRATNGSAMTALPKQQEPPESDPFVDDPKGMMALAQRSFAKAVERALDENDRLGLPSPGGRDGKVVMRQPGAAKPSTDPA